MNEFKTILSAVWESDGYGCIITEWEDVVMFWAGKINHTKEELAEVLNWSDFD